MNLVHVLAITLLFGGIAILDLLGFAVKLRVVDLTRLVLPVVAIGPCLLPRIELTLFMIEWNSSPALRRRCQAGLNKGEAAHKLKRAVFFHRAA
nr:Tn3 family transposase [Rhizobium sullae]